MLMSRERLTICLIKPSKYDDDGFVIRHWKSSLPSNTLACLNALTEEAIAQGKLGTARVKIELYDETVQTLPLNKITRCTRKGKVIVALVGVQSNQFARATDIAETLCKGGVKVAMGGFHVSGAYALCKEIPFEVQALIDQGVTVVMGEAEDAWGDILEDMYHNRARPYYNLLDQKPNLTHAAVPQMSKHLSKRYAFPNMGTIDAGRGCPFTCEFCTIINVQGRKMRTRSPEAVVQAIRRYHKQGIEFYFFTDDNFSRNKNWRDIFREMIKLREEEGIKVEFMMQVDTLSSTIKDFVHMAVKAGCTQVFIGMESLNPKNLASVGKTQNKVDNYREMIQTWHAHDISTHVGYILGFPFDTYDSIMKDVETLKREIEVDRVSFFILAPFPGSVTHFKMKQANIPMDSDLNRFDTFHVVTDHNRMSRAEWQNAYQDAWQSFYSMENMKAVLERSSRVTYWGNMIQFLWYRHSVLQEEHPMMSGMYRFKDFHTRRSTFPCMPKWAYLKMRTRDLGKTVYNWWRLLVELETIWLETRCPAYDHITTIRKLKINWGDLWRNVRTFSLRGLCKQATVKVAGEYLWVQQFAGRLVLRSRRHRKDLNTKWRQIITALKHNRLAPIQYVRVGFVLLREALILASFGSTFLLKTLFDPPTASIHMPPASL